MIAHKDPKLVISFFYPNLILTLYLYTAEYTRHYAQRIDATSSFVRSISCHWRVCHMDAAVGNESKNEPALLTVELNDWRKVTGMESLTLASP